MLNSQIWEYIFANLVMFFRKSGNISQLSELFPAQTLLSDCSTYINNILAEQ